MVSQIDGIYYGLTTDEKPTDGVRNGSKFMEMDKETGETTNKVYLYDQENKEWREWNQ